jgi:RND family efflux transporter MFP subunit
MAAETIGIGRVSFLEQALWKQFQESSDVEAFTRAWLGLQCTFIPAVEAGVVVLGEADTGPFAPVARWPMTGATSGKLAAAAELVVKERRGVAQGQDAGVVGAAAGPAGSKSWQVGYPIMLDGRLCGVVALEIAAGRRDQLRGVMRQLQWGVGWMEALLRREQSRRDKDHFHRMVTTFELMAAALEPARFQDACNAIVTELATRLSCDQVSVGFVRRGNVAVAAVSHAAQFGRRMNMIRDLGNAMDEAVDQKAIVLYPPRSDWEYRIDRAHRDLARANGSGVILTIPLHQGGRFFGAVTFERPLPPGFDESTVELCDCVAGVVGPILDEKRQNDRLAIVKLALSLWTQLKRLFGPRYFGRKLATALAALVVSFFALATADFTVIAPASVEGSVQRSFVAPFEGYIAAQYVRAGDLVRSGQLMATLDDKDLVIERLKWETKRSEHRAEYGKALAKGERASAQIIQAQMEQADAQIALLDEEIKRTRIASPFDGLVISGDLSQSVGAAVRRGDELFQVAPLDSYRVILKIDERDVTEMRPGQTGTLLLAAMPLDPLRYVVTRLTPIAEVEEGSNNFRVEAELKEMSDRLRPGMKGTGKTDVDRRLLIYIWTRRLIDWVRVALWKWLP